MTHSHSVWNTAPTSAPARRKGRYAPGSSAHPAKMHPGIAAHAIATYTRPGDLVLDPMCGIGTTLVEALHLGRNALGIEYEPKWATLASLNARAAAQENGTGTGIVRRGDARHLTALAPTDARGQVDLVVTSPPYGPSVHGQVRSTRETGEPGVVKKDFRYGHDRANLAHVPTTHLIEAFTQIIAQCRTMLRPGGTVVVTTRPWREHGELIDLPSAVLAAGKTAGLTPSERCVALLAGIRNSHVISRPSFFQMKNVRDARRSGIPLSVVQHEDVLIFTKLRANGMPCSRSSTPASTAGVRSRACAPRSKPDVTEDVGGRSVSSAVLRQQGER
ncbi:TRM11 family SAM-dependent methyltransferase [Streptomyces noursei]|uniref:TRM11 family SAM-dependent methyltransferase n=1 Tax=Streptomyces noursei TaxID=1971 RepID=UPI00167441CC|nr:DNA methyltransferase [Streptomyces noursei]MCZ1014795.1 DNA methyltransferase [Streptomyces noursei]GGW97719.1 hypothetical protein GCM10010341_19040 [Streptomyces noursei]